MSTMPTVPHFPHDDVATERLGIPELAEAIAFHNERYHADDAPVIADAEFDALVRRLQQLAPDHPLLHHVGAQAASEDKVEHRTPMLSLDKCNNEAEFRRWSKAAPGAPLVATPKIDGLACSLVYAADGRLRLGATRGDGVRGENVTANVRRLPSVPGRLALATGLAPDVTGREIEVRGEVYLPLSEFAKVQDQFANPRNLAAGTLKSKENPAIPVASLQFLAYDLLGVAVASEREKSRLLAHLGFTPAEQVACDEDAAAEVFAAFAAKRADLDLELDGVVFRFDDLGLQTRLGITSHHPRGAVAWKFAADAGVSTLQDVEWSVSRTGTITPVALVAPVVLSGATVTRASLHNVSTVRRLGLRQGDTVDLMRRGGVIPHLEATRGGGNTPIEPPETCPSCGSPTRLVETEHKASGRRTEILMCSRPEQCTLAKHRQLLHFCDALELEGFGDKVIDTLMEAGLVTEPADLYTLQPGDLEALPRFGKTMIENLLRQVERAKTVELAAFLRSLGIDSLGKHAAKLLADRWDLPAIRAQPVEALRQLHSLGDITAEQIVQGLRDQTAAIDHLLQHITVVRATATASGEGPLAGQQLVFTGRLERMGRRDAQQRVLKLGGLAGDSVTKETTLLVVAQDELDATAPSAKLKKARKLQEAGGAIQIESETAFWARLDEMP